MTVRSEEARAQALSILELDAADLNAETLNAAWRRRAFETHPDRGHDSADAFIAVRGAYLALRDKIAPPAPPNRTPPPEPPAPTHVAPRRPGSPVRPRAHAEGSAITDAFLASCEAALADDDNDFPAAIPTLATRQGRRVEFVFSGRLAPGKNRIALPTGIVTDDPGRKPFKMTLTDADTAEGTYILSDLRVACFPGTNSVTLRFP